MRDDEKLPEQPAIQWRIEEWFPDLSKETSSQLKRYHDEILKVNRSLSLISLKTVAMADALHFADSILASRIIYKSNPSIDQIYDFGSGGGFPGVVFSILYPMIKVVLVESDKKKAEFLQSLPEILKLKNVSIMAQAVDSLPDGSVRYAMARGLSSISKSIMIARKCVVKGGAFYHLKSEEWGMEVSEIPTQLCSIWSPSLTGEYKLPVGPVRFAIVQTEKIA